MATESREVDSKVLRQPLPIALKRGCDRVLDEARQILSAPEASPGARVRFETLANLIDDC
jgi:hypothetical protein